MQPTLYRTFMSTTGISICNTMDFHVSFSTHLQKLSLRKAATQPSKARIILLSLPVRKDVFHHPSLREAAPGCSAELDAPGSACSLASHQLAPQAGEAHDVSCP